MSMIGSIFAFFIGKMLHVFRLIVGFFFSYSVLWPIQSLRKGEECFRDFLFGIGEDKQRSARLTSWFLTPENYYIQVKLAFSKKNPSFYLFFDGDHFCLLRSSRSITNRYHLQRNCPFIHILLQLKK